MSCTPPANQKPNQSYLLLHIANFHWNIVKHIHLHYGREHVYLLTLNYSVSGVTKNVCCCPLHNTIEPCIICKNHTNNLSSHYFYIKLCQLHKLKHKWNTPTPLPVLSPSQRNQLILIFVHLDHLIFNYWKCTFIFKLLRFYIKYTCKSLTLWL